jgi:hypothetical protein
MFCRKCYSLLTPDIPRCSKCNRPFSPDNPRSFLARPFPPRIRILWHLILTTALAVFAAYVVALHQLAANSGH